LADEAVYVFDACAVIALLQEEPGAEVVSSLLLDSNSRCLLHAINLCEVFYDQRRRGQGAQGQALADLLTRTGFEIYDRMPLSLWESAGRLKADIRKISLADCFAIALTLESGGILVSSDHHELDPVAAAGICNIRFIRP
jgi:uncharacterized protein with PIN domain